jgi:P-type Mg2+ transporter
VTEPCVAPSPEIPPVEATPSRYANWPSPSTFTVFQRLDSSPDGLTEQSAADRLRQLGENLPGRYTDDGFIVSVRSAVKSPFVALLAELGVVFDAVLDADGATTVAVRRRAAPALTR